MPISITIGTFSPDKITQKIQKISSGPSGVSKKE
jgi:hypothetical protein